MVKEDAVCGDPVKSGGFANVVIAVGAGMRPTPVVGDGKDDVRTLGAEGRASNEMQKKAGNAHALRIEARGSEGKKLHA